MQKYNWKILEYNAQDLIRIQTEFGISRPTAMILRSRGLFDNDIERFFRPKLKDLSDPFEMPDMEIAVKRIWKAIEHNEKILVHGDFDTDGITSTALLTWVLKENGARVDAFLPHRINDGYGLTTESIDKGVDGHTLLITVDCGITSNEGASYAKSKNIDLIITDHHQPGPELPDALAIINPKIHDHLKSWQVLAGVGVAFKLSHGLLKYARDNNMGGDKPDLREGMDLVALGTVADIVPLTNENRCMVKYGMMVLSNRQRPGIHALCESSGIEDSISTDDIAFKLAPRINAAGRMGDALDALTLLQSSNIRDAYEMADQLNIYNSDRQSIEESVYQEAVDQIQLLNPKNLNSIVVAGKNWHRGVIGIVASRLTQEYFRPCIVLSEEDGVLQGSGRSVEGVNLVTTLECCKENLQRFGGHPMAVGLSLEADRLEVFRKDFERNVQHSCSGTDTLTPSLCLDGKVDICELELQFFREMYQLQPFGHKNPQPKFQINSVNCHRVYPAGENHSRGVFYDRYGSRMNFIFFGMKPCDYPPPPWDIVAIADLNTYNGVTKPQLQILDIRSSD